MDVERAIQPLIENAAKSDARLTRVENGLERIEKGLDRNKTLTLN